MTGPHLSLFFPSLRGGGVPRTMTNLAEGFLERGISKVDLVVIRDEPAQHSLPTGARVICLKSRRVMASLAPLARYLRKSRPTAMLSAIDVSNVVAIWARALAQVDTRLVANVCTTVSAEYWGEGAKRNVRRLRLMPYLMRRFYPWADSVTTVSEAVRDDLVRTTKLAKDRVEVIYNPVVTDQLFERAAASVDLPWPSEPSLPVVLAVGRLTPAKDYSTLLRAFARVRQHRAARLVILGEGPLRAEIEAFRDALGLQDSVLLPGHAENPYPAMAAADVFVLSSCWEGFGNVLVETMALGTPVVATRAQGPCEILSDGRFGPLVDIGDDVALAERIDRLIADRCAPAGARARAMEFGFERSVDAYLNLLLGRQEAEQYMLAC